MNAINSYAEFENAERFDTKSSVDETYWGYIIRNDTDDCGHICLLQTFSWVTGLSLLIAAAAFWILPGSSFGASMMVMKLGMSGFLAFVGMMLVRFGRQGSKYELQIDLAKGEVREAVRNAKGNVQILKRSVFANVGAVFIEKADAAGGKTGLMLQYNDSAEIIEIVEDDDANLRDLRDRIRRDVLGKAAPLRQRKARGFLFGKARGLIQPGMAA